MLLLTSAVDGRDFFVNPDVIAYVWLRSKDETSTLVSFNGGGCLEVKQEASEIIDAMFELGD